MKEIVVLSGKGGTGKTTITASFAALAHKKILVDCDVDAADLHLIFKPTVLETHQFFGGKSAFIDKDLCTACGKCGEICRYDAVNLANKEINKFLCEGCSACSHFCPTGAIKMEDDLSGYWFISHSPYGPFVHARLGIAEENSGKLVSLIRSKARALAEKEKAQLIINDGSPGIGCPVIASITGADYVLIVVEPTLSGIHDLKRVVQLAAHFNIPTGVCINKIDINPQMADKISRYCTENNIKVLGSLPYDNCVTKAQVAQKPVVVEYPEREISKKIQDLWKEVEKALS